MQKTITICGSMQFADQMTQLRRTLQSMTYNVYIPDDAELDSGYDQLDEAAQIELKRSFIDSHLGYIKLSGAILVANFEKNGVAGYIGPNTLMEIAFAYVLKKRIFILNSVGDQNCKLEVLGMKPIVLNGRVDLLKI